MNEYEVGEIPPEQLKKQAKRYGLEDFVKGRVDNETLDRIAHKADELQRMNLSEEDKAVLEDKVRALTKDNESLEATIEEMAKENQSLKQAKKKSGAKKK